MKPDWDVRPVTTDQLGSVSLIPVLAGSAALQDRAANPVSFRERRQ
jgi:hypothetical protein